MNEEKVDDIETSLNISKRRIDNLERNLNALYIWILILTFGVVFLTLYIFGLIP